MEQDTIEVMEPPPSDTAPRQLYFRQHMFLCINRRNNARSCAGSGSERLLDYIKKRARDMGISSTLDLRVNRSGCLGRCEHGPTAVVYPDGVWYHYETRADLDEILEEHIGNGRVVERLRIRSG
jgi:(2Fe-2S) ferredoxin